MSVLGIALVNAVQQDSVNNGKFYLGGMYTGIDPTNRVNQTSFNIGNVDPALTALQLEAAIKQYVKDELTNTYGYTFGLFDSVRLIGALL